MRDILLTLLAVVLFIGGPLGLIVYERRRVRKTNVRPIRYPLPACTSGAERGAPISRRSR